MSKKPGKEEEGQEDSLTFIREYAAGLREQERINRDSFKVIRPRLPGLILAALSNKPEWSEGDIQESASYLIKPIESFLIRAREYKLELAQRLGKFPLTSSVRMADLAVLSATEDKWLLSQHFQFSQFSAEDLPRAFESLSSQLVELLSLIFEADPQIYDFVDGKDLTSGAESTQPTKEEPR